VEALALLQMLEDPLRGLFGKPALACAADDYRDSGHVLMLYSLKSRFPEKRG
jgi:hypothetical protein